MFERETLCVGVNNDMLQIYFDSVTAATLTLTDTSKPCAFHSWFTFECHFHCLQLLKHNQNRVLYYNYNHIEKLQHSKIKYLAPC